MASFGFNDSLTELKHISHRHAKVLKKHNIHSMRDIIYYFPRKHLDRTNVTLIKNIVKGSNYNIVGKVEAFDEKKTRFKKIFQVIISDNSGIITCTWFNSIKFVKKLFKKGDLIALHGKVEWYNGFVINHPEFDILDGDENPTNTGSIIPIYPLTNDFKAIGFEQRVIRKIISQIINNIDFEQDNIKESFLKQNNMVNIGVALKQIHFPENRNSLNAAIFRLKFDEHLLLQLFIAMKKKYIKSAKTKPLKSVGPYFKRVRDLLEFEITNSQKKVLKEIHTDLKSDVCMNRLLQGDVGSGKTIVAVLSALLAVGNNVQVALMAPTEILASQHFETFNKDESPSKEAFANLIKLFVGKPFVSA